MLALHQTSPRGRRDLEGGAKNPNMGYAPELARRGYVVLCPDYPSFGDYPYDFSKDDYVSGSMKGVFNHMRCVDLLRSRDDVDGERIGVIGHSLGGHNAMFLAAFDERREGHRHQLRLDAVRRLLRRQDRRLDERAVHAAAQGRVRARPAARALRLLRSGRGARAAAVLLQLARRATTTSPSPA